MFPVLGVKAILRVISGFQCPSFLFLTRNASSLPSFSVTLPERSPSDPVPGSAACSGQGGGLGTQQRVGMGKDHAPGLRGLLQL